MPSCACEKRYVPAPPRRNSHNVFAVHEKSLSDRHAEFGIPDAQVSESIAGDDETTIGAEGDRLHAGVVTVEPRNVLDSNLPQLEFSVMGCRKDAAVRQE